MVFSLRAVTLFPQSLVLSDHIFYTKYSPTFGSHLTPTRLNSSAMISTPTNLIVRLGIALVFTLGFHRISRVI
ncbi:hypothetical protein VP424E501_P0305 [Vibrio phage 424E50-1]|nr:hypothetical protein VP424E501_P0305 [Vibrio phage 424E50-1]